MVAGVFPGSCVFNSESGCKSIRKLKGILSPLLLAWPLPHLFLSFLQFGCMEYRGNLGGNLEES